MKKLVGIFFLMSILIDGFSQNEEIDTCLRVKFSLSYDVLKLRKTDKIIGQINIINCGSDTLLITKYPSYGYSDDINDIQLQVEFLTSDSTYKEYNFDKVHASFPKRFIKEKLEPGSQRNYAISFQELYHINKIGVYRIRVKYRIFRLKKEDLVFLSNWSKLVVK